jgi:hypothetical protein
MKTLDHHEKHGAQGDTLPESVAAQNEGHQNSEQCFVKI